jgi:hypothetical protein
MIVLKCDYDTARFPAGVWQRIGMVSRVHRLRVDYVRIDKTRNGWHVLVGVRGRPVSPVRLVLIQALLGSDWKRELFNSRRALVSRRVPTFWRGRMNVLYTRHHRGVIV